MKGTVISLRLSAELLKKIDAVSENRNGFIKEAILEKLSPKPAVVSSEEEDSAVSAEFTKPEKRAMLKETKNLSDILHEAMLDRLRREKDILDSMTREDFLKLVAGRLPKESVIDDEIDREVLSLRECLGQLPSIPDITHELNKVKGELFKVKAERDLNIDLLKYSQGSLPAGEFAGRLFRRVVEYVANLAARNSIPGLGDGGGLTEKGYAAISEVVRREVENLEIFRK